MLIDDGVHEREHIIGETTCTALHIGMCMKSKEYVMLASRDQHARDVM